MINKFHVFCAHVCYYPRASRCQELTGAHCLEKDNDEQHGNVLPFVCPIPWWELTKELFCYCYFLAFQAVIASSTLHQQIHLEIYYWSILEKVLYPMDLEDLWCLVQGLPDHNWHQVFFAFPDKVPVPYSLSNYDTDSRSKLFCDRIQERIVVDFDTVEKSGPKNPAPIVLVVCSFNKDCSIAVCIGVRRR